MFHLHSKSPYGAFDDTYMVKWYVVDVTSSSMTMMVLGDHLPGTFVCVTFVTWPRDKCLRVPTSRARSRKISHSTNFSSCTFGHTSLLMSPIVEQTSILLPCRVTLAWRLDLRNKKLKLEILDQDLWSK